MTAPRAFAGLSRPQRKGDQSSGLVRVKRDMAGKQTSPGGPACTGKGAGLDAALTSTRAPRAVRLETTFPRGGPRGAGGKETASDPVRRCESHPWLYKGGLGDHSFLCVGGARGVVVVRLTARLHTLSSCPLEQPAGIEWILEEGVTTGPPRKPRVDIYNLRSPDEFIVGQNQALIEPG
ncbi:uncharacterized protein LOC101016588 [Papio anubis]|uniref:uncharacterized protein LOC101016588 n=1 Tax=Papio anubis TaxID=9555 RepID=UPI0012AD24A8|nr:uncharacterized protein LOC101016588 [Papio anubis]